MRPLVSVITATIPGREHFLVENEASVRAQTFRQWEHLVWRDEDREGCSASYNRLASEAQGEWLFVIADDDLMLPSCLGAHLAHAEYADIVYAPPLVWGEDEEQFCGVHPAIPAVALIRKALWDNLGGYDVRRGQQEDRDLYVRADEKRARFVRFVDQPTWVYRLGHGGNKSRNKGVAT